MLYELLYTSAALTEMDAEALRRLLKQARSKNAQLQVTGLLVYHNREFMQLIEGDEETVLSLWKTIQFDDRHVSARIIYEGPVDERGFADWQMGFRDLGNVEAEALEGFSDFLDKGFTSEVVGEKPSIARDLMDTLRDYLVPSQAA